MVLHMYNNIRIRILYIINSEIIYYMYHVIVLLYRSRHECRLYYTFLFLKSPFGILGCCLSLR